MKTSALVRQTARTSKQAGDPYLKLQIANSVYAVLLMRKIQEVLTLPAAQLTSMPNMPACILGLMNRRSQIYWVVDLAKLLGIEPLDAGTQQYNVAIARVGSMTLGLAVRKVDSKCWLAPEEIQPSPPHLAAEITSYLQGYVLRQPQTLLVLDVDSIMNSSVFYHPQEWLLE